MAYSLVFTRAAAKQYRRLLGALTDAEAKRFGSAFEHLQENPYPNHNVPSGIIRHLGGPTWRFKPTHRHRIVYSIDGQTVTVEQVVDRKDAYRLF